MNKLVIIAIVLAFSAAVYAQSCDSNTLSGCLSTYTTCALNNILNKDALCSCYTAYAKCWVSTNCATGDSFTSWQKTCVDAGCPAASCNSASTVSAVFGLAVAVVAALF